MLNVQHVVFQLEEKEMSVSTAQALALRDLYGAVDLYLRGLGSQEDLLAAHGRSREILGAVDARLGARPLLSR